MYERDKNMLRSNREVNAIYIFISLGRNLIVMNNKVYIQFLF